MKIKPQRLIILLSTTRAKQKMGFHSMWSAPVTWTSTAFHLTFKTAHTHSAHTSTQVSEPHFYLFTSSIIHFINKSSFLPPERDVQLFFSESAENTLKSSLFYMETKGEWELIDLLAGKPQNSTYFNFDGLDSWDELAYYVCVNFTR